MPPGLTKLSTADVERVPIASVVIGLRRRQSLGSLLSLKRSIGEHGLMHPILLRKGAELVAGRRRLEACRQLGWADIPARRVDGLSDDDLRAIELQENTEREALNDYETSKARLAEIRQEEADAKSPASELRSGPERKQLLPGPGKNLGGRPPKATSRRAIAEQTGISRQEQERIEKHVEIAERYPFMQRAENGWVKHTVLRAGEALEKLPKAEHRTVVALVDQAGAPAQKAVQMIQSIADMPDTARAAVYEKIRSGAEHDRKTAITMAMREAPPPDPAALVLSAVARECHRAVKVCRDETLMPKVERLAEQVDALLEQFTALQAKRFKTWQDSLTT